jgi:hypothetical protein
LLKCRTRTAYSRSAAANSAPPLARCLAKTNLALTDTRADQGSLRAVALSRPQRLAEGATGRDIAFIPAKAGDLIVWDWRLPPGNSKNLSTRPRLAFYVAMYPNTNTALRDAAIESWRSGRCVPWRNRRATTTSSPGRRRA